MGVLDRHLSDLKRSVFKAVDSATKVAVRIASEATDPIYVSDTTNGTTDHFNGTVTTTPINIPTTAGNNITRIMIANLSEKKGEDLEVSFDGGTTFTTIFAGEAFTWEPKSITQVDLQSNVVLGVAYESVVNRE